MPHFAKSAIFRDQKSLCGFVQGEGASGAHSMPLADYGFGLIRHTDFTGRGTTRPHRDHVIEISTGAAAQFPSPSA
jgi:hypothetical protein